MLLIDDEADNASINVRYGKDEVTRINGQLRDLLRLFARSCYVGYTATPFANIFIDPDTDDEMLGQDLFPRHFIVSLDPPSNYFGPDKVFREETKGIVRHIADNEATLPLRHDISLVVNDLPDSLYTAIRSFVVARAVRLHRGHSRQHCSMLVNVSRFTGVQGQVNRLIQAFIQDIQAAVRLHCGLPTEQALRDPEVSALQQVWRQEFAGSADWSAVQKQLLEAASPIRVVEVNNQSHGTLNYDEYEATGLSVIAVGGFSLSRGLTLEGLMVSYFLRNSMMYDTLMQMGRWFGYRPEYEDLCRVWMLEEAEGWYAHIAESMEMLRGELRTMAAAGATPEEFGLKVRSHPDTLIVTARNKMGSGENLIVRVGLANRFVETAMLKNDAGSVAANRKAASQLAEELSRLGHPLSGGSRPAGGWLLSGVPVEPILRFLRSFINHPRSILTDPETLGHYIEDRSTTELATWDLFVPSIGSPDETIPDSLLGITVNCQRRTIGSRSDGNTVLVTNKQRVASRGIEQIGLSDSSITQAEENYRHSEGKAGAETINFPDHIYRERRERPLLVLHLLNLQKDREVAGIIEREPLRSEGTVAWSVSFPVTQLPEQRVEYVVTTTWLRENLRPELEDEAEDLDDV
jgi:hypothetical protein